MLRHAVVHTPYYAAQDWAKDFRKGKNIEFKDIPILAKDDLKTLTAEFYAAYDTKSEGVAVEKFTSGSTGVPLRLFKTPKHFNINAIENARLKSGWFPEDRSISLGMNYPDDKNPAKSISIKQTANGGTHHTLYSFSSNDIAELLEHLKPSLLKGRASVVLPALQQLKNLDSLRLITTISEILSPELVAFVKTMPNCGLVDVYGSVETGIIAATCKLCGKYHLAERHMVIEVLDEKNIPTKPGNIGRIIITPLFNYAMPLIRYDIGDYVELSDSHSCQISRFAFNRIIGRERNLFKLPKGGKIIPNISPEDLLLYGIARYKLVQISKVGIEFRYLPSSPDTTISSALAQKIIARNMSPEFQVEAISVTDFPTAANGKYLMHECLI